MRCGTGGPFSVASAVAIGRHVGMTAPISEWTRTTMSFRRSLHHWQGELRDGRSAATILPAMEVERDVFAALREEAPERKHGSMDRLLAEADAFIALLRA